MAVGQDVFPPLEQSAVRVGLELVASFPARTKFQDLVDAPDARKTLYVVDTDGRVLTAENGVASARPFLDLTKNADFYVTLGRTGLRSLAFHPESFSTDPAAEGRGLVYASYTATLASRPAGGKLFDGVRSTDAPEYDLVVAEWRFDPATGVVDEGSKRELFRVATNNTPHVSGVLRFDPGARPGDADYGNLYVTIGDLSSNALNLDLSRPNGKFLRIDPTVQPDGKPYGVPADNPFVGTPGALPEVFLTGARNPQSLFFDHLGTDRAFFGDVSGERIEEINVVVPGANYGWPSREGTLIRQASPQLVYDFLPSPLPASDRFHYPFTGYDHEELPVAEDAIALGGVVRGPAAPALAGKMVFSNFPDGSLFVADLDSLDAAMQDGRITPDEFAAPRRLTNLEFEGKPTTLLALLGGGGPRADARFGVDAAGDLYVFGKYNGRVYRFVSTDAPGGEFVLNLVDTRTDAPVGALANGAVLRAAAPPGARSISADFSGPEQSIELQLFDAGGRLLARTVANAPPYALFGSRPGGDFLDPAIPIPAGSYRLVATAFAGDDATGAALGSKTVSFTLQDAVTAADIVFKLIDTRSDLPVETLTDGASFDPGLRAAVRGFAVEVAGGETPARVALALYDSANRLVASVTDRSAPYALFGDAAGDFADPPGPVRDGAYRLEAVAYRSDNSVIVSETASFTLQEGNFVFKLVDTAADVELGTIEDGARVAVGTPARSRGFAVDLLGVNSEESMVLELFDAGGRRLFRSTDSITPYALFGESAPGDFSRSPFPVDAGAYRLRATAFSRDDGEGVVLAQRQITFTLEDGLRPPAADRTLVVDPAGDVDRLPDAPGVNLGASREKTHALTFTTRADVETRQMLYEQGGALRGLNFFIEDGKLFAAAWNLQRSGGWGYRQLSAEIDAGSRYVATLVLDGDAPRRGSLTLYLGGEERGSTAGVGWLGPHPNDIGVGEVAQHSRIGRTVLREQSASPFAGEIEKLAQYDRALDGASLDRLHAYMGAETFDVLG